MRNLQLLLVAGLLVCEALVAPAAALAQANAPAALTNADVQQTDRRLKKLEGELRAVQRKVFPGGAGAAELAPEIVAPVVPVTADGVPASNPLADLAARVGEMERQLRSLTGQVEANGFKLRQLETAIERARGDVEFRLTRLEGGTSGSLGGEPPLATPEATMPAAGSVRPPAATQPATRPGAMVPPVGKAPVAAAVPPKPNAVASSAISKGTNAATDWTAAYAQALKKDWPSTEAHMLAFTEHWPESFRAAQAQYWLGRSFAERAMHAQAADAYLKVYNKYPLNDRAPDALLGLAGALIGIKNPQQACRVLGELESVYAAKLGATRSSDAKALRTQAKCS